MAWSTYLFLRRQMAEEHYDTYKIRIGRSLLLGLEVVVAADIVKTIAVEPSLMSLYVLAGLVLIRTFLSWTLVLEIEGRWPWQRDAGSRRLDADAHQFCLAHLIRDAQYAIDAGDTVFAPSFKEFLKRACEIGRRRPNLADSTIKAHARSLDRELDRLIDLEPTNADGRHLRDAIIVDALDKLLVFLTRRDVEPTNNASERSLRPSVVFRKVTNGFRSDWGAKVYADLCSIVSTGRLNGWSPLTAIRAALTTRFKPATPDYRGPEG